MKLYDIPREMVTDVWSAVEPMLTRALEHHPHLTTPGLLKLLMTEYAALIIATERGRIIAAAVMERVAYPDHTVGNIVAFGGQYGTYRKYVNAFADHCEAWSRARGCDRIAFVGRSGWTKFIVRRGGEQVPLVHAWKSLQ